MFEYRASGDRPIGKPPKLGRTSVEILTAICSAPGFAMHAKWFRVRIMILDNAAKPRTQESNS